MSAASITYVPRRRGNPRNGSRGVPASRASKTPRKGLLCPECKRSATIVIDSRQAPNNSTRRSRACPACGFRFTTYEIWHPDIVIDFHI